MQLIVVTFAGFSCFSAQMAKADPSEATLTFANEAYYSILKAAVDEYGLGKGFPGNAWDGVYYSEVLDFDNDGVPELMLCYGIFDGAQYFHYLKIYSYKQRADLSHEAMYVGGANFLTQWHIAEGKNGQKYFQVYELGKWRTISYFTIKEGIFEEVFGSTEVISNGTAAFDGNNDAENVLGIVNSFEIPKNASIVQSLLADLDGKSNVSALSAPANNPTSAMSISVLVNGNAISFDQSPIIQDGRTLVPIRAIFEAIGANVNWDPDTQTVTAARGDILIMLTIGSQVLHKNGQQITLDVPAQIYGGRTLVPARAVAETFGADVSWDQDSQTVTINTIIPDDY